MAVRVCGLKSSPELNGVLGLCHQWDAEGSRWIVRFESGKLKKFRPQNLAPCTEPAPQEPTGPDEYGPAWFGLPEPEASMTAGQVSDVAAPVLDGLPRELHTPGNGAMSCKPGCADFGKDEYWARLGLGGRR